MEVIERAVHGFTAIELTCIVCGDVEFHYALGDQRTPSKTVQ